MTADFFGGLAICTRYARRPMTLRPHLAMGLPFRDNNQINFVRFYYMLLNIRSQGAKFDDRVACEYLA